MSNPVDDQARAGSTLIQRDQSKASAIASRQQKAFEASLPPGAKKASAAQAKLTAEKVAARN